MRGKKILLTRRKVRIKFSLFDRKYNPQMEKTSNQLNIINIKKFYY